jgi:hypothetical protein
MACKAWVRSSRTLSFLRAPPLLSSLKTAVLQSGHLSAALLGRAHDFASYDAY